MTDGSMRMLMESMIIDVLQKQLINLIMFTTKSPTELARMLHRQCKTMEEKVAMMTILRMSVFHTDMMDHGIRFIDPPCIERCMNEWRNTRRMLNRKRQIYLRVNVQFWGLYTGLKKNVGVW